MNDREKAEAAVLEAAYRIKAIMSYSGHRPGALFMTRLALIRACLNLPGPEPKPEAPRIREDAPRNCQRRMMAEGLAYPRTCPLCKLGPCPYLPEPAKSGGRETGSAQDR